MSPFGERPDSAEAGVVHEYVDGSLTERPLDLFTRARVGQVRADDNALRAVPVLQLVRELFERRLPSRGQHEVVPLPREDPGELEADPGGCAGHEGGRS